MATDRQISEAARTIAQAVAQQDERGVSEGDALAAIFQEYGAITGNPEAAAKSVADAGARAGQLIREGLPSDIATVSSPLPADTPTGRGETVPAMSNVPAPRRSPDAPTNAGVADPASISKNVSDEAKEKLNPTDEASDIGPQLPQEMVTAAGDTVRGAEVISGPNADTNTGDDEGEDDIDVEESTVDEVLDAVGDDPEKARRALEAEEASESPRTTLTERLERIAEKDSGD